MVNKQQLYHFLNLLVPFVYGFDRKVDETFLHMVIKSEIDLHENIIYPTVEAE